MNNIKQRIAIAKACGWTQVESDVHPNLMLWQPPNKKGFDYTPPDYLNDLNAMHKAEHILFSSKKPLWDTFVKHLYQIGYRGESTTKYAIHATAAQRAEAFLKTLKLWESE